MPMALYSFFDEYDFSGKTIIPFNVHNGSRFSDTISTIEELEPDAQVVEETCDMPVMCVKGSYDNIKITTREDLKGK